MITYKGRDGIVEYHPAGADPMRPDGYVRITRPRLRDRIAFFRGLARSPRITIPLGAIDQIDVLADRIVFVAPGTVRWAGPGVARPAPNAADVPGARVRYPAWPTTVRFNRGQRLTFEDLARRIAGAAPQLRHIDPATGR